MDEYTSWHSKPEYVSQGILSSYAQANGPSEWAQITHQVPPHVSYVPLDITEEGNSKQDKSTWSLYRYFSDQCPAWPSLLATTNREKAKLLIIIHDVSTMLYSGGAEQLSANQVLQQYRRFTTWRKSLPSVIGDLDNNHSQALPHVLSLL